MSTAQDLPWTHAEREAQTVRDHLGESWVLMPHGPVNTWLISPRRDYGTGNQARHNPAVRPCCSGFVDKFGLTWLCDLDAGHTGECTTYNASPLDAVRERERIGGAR